MISTRANITIDVRMLYHSGIGTYISNILPIITSARPDIRFNLLGNASELRQSVWTDRNNINLIHCTSPIYSLSEQYELFQKNPGNSSVFWSPHYNIPLLPIRARRVVTIHDVYHLAFYNRLNLSQKLYAKIVMNSAVKISDKIITVSNFSESEIKKYISVNPGKITVIHNGITSIISRDSTKVPPEKFILYVGNVKPHKNLKRLLVAYSKLLAQGFKDYDLVIAGKKDGFITGDNEIFDFIDSKPALKDRVKFTGYLKNDDIAKMYSAASLFVFPSLYEGFGFPPLEAMAGGCPVVVSNIPSLKEVCGEAAFYIDPLSEDSLFEGMRRVLEDNRLRQGLIKMGTERLNCFSWEKAAHEHIKIFDDMLSIG